MINLTFLRSFCLVIRHASFTQAASELGCSQSTISAQITTLERQLSCRVLSRRRGRIEPTPAGKILLEYSQRILGLADEAEERLMGNQDRLIGTLRVAASSIPASYILPGLLGSFVTTHEALRLEIVACNSLDALQRIQSGEFELGVVGELPIPRGLTSLTIASDHIRLALPKNHRWSAQKSITLDALQNLTIIDREAGSGTMAIVNRQLEQRGFKGLKRQICLGSTTAVVQGVRAGLGPAFLSHLAIQDAGLPSVSITGIDLTRRFCLVHRPRSGLSAAAAALLEHLTTGTN